MRVKVKLSFDVTEEVNRQLETLAVKRNRAKAREGITKKGPTAIVSSL